MHDVDDDADFRTAMLSTVEEETRRLDAALSGLQALIGALTDQQEPHMLELDAELREATVEASRRQVTATVLGCEELAVRVRQSFRSVVAALLGIASDGGAPVEVSARPSDGGVAVRITRVDGSEVRSDRALVQSLLVALGAEHRVSTDAVEFWLCSPDDG